jgi:hypothetical protein
MLRNAYHFTSGQALASLKKSRTDRLRARYNRKSLRDRYPFRKISESMDLKNG